MRSFFGFSWLSAFLYEFCIEDNVIPVIRPKQNVLIRRGNQDDIEIARTVLPVKWIEEFQQRLSENKIWIIGLVKNRLAYSSWITFNEETETGTGLVVHPMEKDAYIFNSYTVPEFRKLGLHTYMTCEQLKVCKEMGIYKVIGIVFKNNHAANKAWQKIGFQKIKLLLTIRFLKWFHIFVSDLDN